MSMPNDLSHLYRLLDIDGNYTVDPDWNTVKNSLLSLKTSFGGQISFHSGGEDSWLIICHKDMYGFYVMGSGIDEIDLYVLYEPSETEKKIAFWDGQEYLGVPRLVFVNENTMLQALETFYQGGYRDRSLDWWLEYELAEHYDIQPIDPDECADY
jgi:hypothetical protein